MPDKKLTDNEIVKALECCGEDSGCPYICPLKDMAYVGDCIQVKSKHALDLINRQKEEIERLKNAYKQVAWERDIFAEDMKEEIKKDCSYLMLDIKTVKAEAYKEFAERLKENLLEQSIVYVKIDNLLKELVGENDAKDND